MKRIKRLTAIMILAAMATVATPQAFGGILITDRSSILLGDRSSILLGDLSSILLGDLASILLGD